MPQLDAPEKPLSSASEPAPSVWKPALIEAAWAFLAAAVLLVIIYALAFKSIHPEFVRFMGPAAKPLTATGRELIPVSVGKGRKEGSQYIIEDFNGDEAVLALPRAFRAEDYPFIKVNLSGFTRYSKAKILWQQVGDPTTHSLELNRSGDEVTQIAMVYGSEAYTGPIDSVALLFYDGPALGIENNNDVDIVLKSIEFRPYSAWRVTEQILEDWTNPPLWQGYSNNIVKGIHDNGLVFPNAVTNAIIMVSAFLTFTSRLIRRWGLGAFPTNPALAVAVVLCLYGWALVEILRWPGRLDLWEDAEHRYASLTVEDKILMSRQRCAMFPKDCGAHLRRLE